MKQFFKSIYKKIFLDLTHYLKKELANCHNVLDLGCGSNSSIQYCDIPFSVGVDIFESYLEKSKKKKIHNQYIKADIRKVEFKPKSFDAVVVLDVLEHLSKEDGYKLIEKMERWTRKKVIIFTPNGYVWQNDYDKNPFQRHKCGWTVDELKNLGFKIRGVNGLKKLRGYGSSIKYKPTFLWGRISDLTQTITYYYPRAAFQLLAVKELDINKNKSLI